VPRANLLVTEDSVSSIHRVGDGVPSERGFLWLLAAREGGMRRRGRECESRLRRQSEAARSDSFILEMRAAVIMDVYHALAFELIFRDGTHLKMYSDGRVEGLTQNAMVVNRVPGLLHLQRLQLTQNDLALDSQPRQVEQTEAPRSQPQMV
jgi:hypothetical protein